MGASDAKATWQRPGVKLAYKTSVSAAEASTFDWLFRESNMVFPRANQSLNTWGLTTGGVIAPAATQKTLGRIETDFSIVGPVTPAAYAVSFISLLQDTTYSVSKHVGIMYTAPILATPIYAHIEGGIVGEKGIHSCVGCVCNSLSLSIPAVGADLGRPMLTTGWIAANATDQDAASAASIANTDTAEPYTSSDFAFTIGGSASNYVSASINIVNNAVRSPANGTTPPAIYKNMIGVTGEITVLRSGASSDEYDQLMTAQAAKSTLELKFATSGGITLLVDANILSPSDSEQDGMAVVTFPFEIVYADANSLVCESTLSQITWS